MCNSAAVKPPICLLSSLSPLPPTHIKHFSSGKPGKSIGLLFVFLFCVCLLCLSVLSVCCVCLLYLCVFRCRLMFYASLRCDCAGALHSLPPLFRMSCWAGICPLLGVPFFMSCWSGSVTDRHSPKLVAVCWAAICYSYGHIIQAVCMRAVQWLYNGCIYVCWVVGRPGQVSTLSHVGGVAPALLPILYSTQAGGSPLS